MIVALGSLHLYLSTQGADEKYRLIDLKMKFRDLRSQNRYLSKIVAEKEKPERVEKIAKTKLKMTWPKKVHYLFVSKEASARIPLESPTID